jgi:hypothetical protein
MQTSTKQKILSRCRCGAVGNSIKVSLLSIPPFRSSQDSCSKERTAVDASDHFPVSVNFISRSPHKMSRATPDDQLKFLLSCVKHSNNGKVSIMASSLPAHDADCSQIDFAEVARECGVVSKGAAFVMLLKVTFLRTNGTLRAKRYERLMKANGINPNGGSDPKPPPLSPPKAPKNNTRAKVAKPLAKRRKVNNAAAKKQEEDSILHQPKQEPEPLESAKVQERSCPLDSAFPPPRANDSHLGPMNDDDSSFDFNEFCSPEMFANCTTDTRQSSQEDASLRAPVLQTASAAVCGVKDLPQATTEEVKEKTPERETVIIAD